MDRGAWWAIAHGVSKSQTQLTLSHTFTFCHLGFPGGSVIKNSLVAPARNAGDAGSIPGSGRSPGEGNGTTL